MIWLSDAKPSDCFVSVYRPFSGGMAQRVALARALINNPRLLLLDEPLGKLDSLTRLAMQTELYRLWRSQGFTALMVTHDVEEALLLATRVIIFSPRPARVIADLRIEDAQPRDRDNPALQKLRTEILTQLEEAMF
ncbi:ABC-type nitrate/sulfonate/bicarbonate transport system [Gluconobacter frateurii NBRC 103465]|nr:ABC-type nitrate/sulfonate/bicarbonate transport system [Gluconobacter frateurii NBRC 103465]